MPKRVLAPSKKCVCPECGTPTKASVRSGRLYEHDAPEGASPCPKSGAVVVAGPELVNSYECACGTWARVTSKGALARHVMPEGQGCPLSGELIKTPAARERPRRVAGGLLRMVPPAPTEGWAKPVTGGSASSVYAIPAGLPGHGGRR
ncbi:hypothetical protein [Streptomyces sp. NPDC056682]|uniref:hypothetical protein n=1 Tax=Streptomyces sp. NPDC056682 TaxID=3345909 RepID=UPI00368FC072